LGLQDEAEKFLWLNDFAAALNFYRFGQWDRAAELFQKVLEQRPNDPPSRSFQNRLNYFRQHPPLPDWQGIYILDTK